MRAIFYGLGSDGTVGANKNSIKIIGEETDNYAQGYFVYDSKKSGVDDRLAPALRPAADPRHLPDQPGRLRRLPPVPLPRAARRAGAAPSRARPSCSTAHSARTRSGTTCRARCRSRSSTSSCKFYVIDANQVARETGMGGRINTIMQTCFFALSGVLPRDEAIAAIKHAIEKTYGKRGEAVVQKNFAAVDAALGHLHEVDGPGPTSTARFDCRPPVPAAAPGVRPRGDRRDDRRRGRRPARSARCPSTAPSRPAPRSGRSATSPSRSRSGTPDALHPVRQVRAGLPARRHPRARCTTRRYLDGAPETLQVRPARWPELQGPAVHPPGRARGLHRLRPLRRGLPGQEQERDASRKAINMVPQPPLREQRGRQLGLLPRLPEVGPHTACTSTASRTRSCCSRCSSSPAPAPAAARRPTSSCSRQLFGDRALIANATGCSSIYGGNLPTTPWTTNREGRGPAWSNSLFEDNAEFGLGMRLTLDKQARVRPRAGRAAARRRSATNWPTRSSTPTRSTEAGIDAQRERVAELKRAAGGRRRRRRRATC